LCLSVFVFSKKNRMKEDVKKKLCVSASLRTKKNEDKKTLCLSVFVFSKK
jgi:hypothetical protein